MGCPDTDTTTRCADSFRNVLENNHVPKAKRYFNAMVEDSTNSRFYLYDACGAYVQLTGNGLGGGGAVDSVNGQTGIVLLDPDDLDDASTSHKFMTAAEKSKLAGIESGAEANDVLSVNGQTGVVVITATSVLPGQAGNNGKFLTTNGTTPSWATIPGGGDMLISVYDPTNKSADAFSMGNMVETSTKKILSDTERTKLSGIETAADVTDAANVTAALNGATLTGVTPASGDRILLQDASDSNNLKYALFSAFGGGGGGAGPLANVALVAASNATAAEIAAATYVCDGTADQTEINTALAAYPYVMLSGGNFNCSGSINIIGTDDDDYADTTRSLIGRGINVTNLIGADNVTVVSLTQSPMVHLEGFTIDVNGSGNGVQSDHSTLMHRGFWQSHFEDIFIINRTGATHTGWGMKLGSAFRSTFSNIEMFGVKNGLQLLAQDADFNPGDCVFSRMFIELNNQSAGVAYHLSSPTGTGSLNQVLFEMCEGIGAGTGQTGILLNGAGAPNHNRFVGINLEQFDTLVNIQTGEGNEVHCNYVECRGVTSLKHFQTGASAWNNRFSAKFIYVDAGLSHALVTDGNTNIPQAPNRFEGIVIYSETGATVTASRQPQTIMRDIVDYGTGNSTAVRRYPNVKAPDSIIVLTDGATPALDASMGNHFKLTAAGNRTIGIPSNPTDGQVIVIEHVASGGARTLGLNTGTGGFLFGTDITALTATASGATDYVSARYNLSKNKWCVIDVKKGF